MSSPDIGETTGDKMDSAWKFLIAPILVAIISGTLVALILDRLRAPDEADISAQLQWLDIPNPVYGEDHIAQDRRIKALKEAYPNSSFISLLQDNRFSGVIRLVRINLENNSDIRSKEIEISSSNALFVSPQAKDQTSPASPIVLKPIGPKETAQVWGISKEWYDFEDPTIRVLHDNRLMGISLETLRQDPTGAVRFGNENPFLASFLMLIGIVLGLLFVGIILLAGLLQYSMKARAYITTKSEAQKTQEFLDYLRANYPEKFS